MWIDVLGGFIDIVAIYMVLKMSASIVRKSLQLFDDDLTPKGAQGKSKKSSKQKREKLDWSKIGKKKFGKGKKSTPVENLAENNIRLLQQLTDASKTEEYYTKSVFGEISKPEQKEEESTLFTEEDFETFEKEYTAK